MFDRFNRRIHYLRISVTDRCNLRCVYCMPAAGVPSVPHAQVLSFEEIAEVTRVAVELGVDKVRLTGGEPLVRSGIVELVRMLAAIDGIKDLAMTSNGLLMPRYAPALRAAGLHRVNISLDSVIPEHYREITRGGCVAEALAGIEAVCAAGFRKVKLNCVVRESPDEDDARSVAAYAAEKGVELRYIRRMDTGKGEFWRVLGGDGGHCAACSRLRLTSTGRIYPCLFSDVCYDVRALGARAALLAAVEAKPEAGRMSANRFHHMGG
jgi:cyclic pyranopterin phosphate synthase